MHQYSTFIPKPEDDPEHNPHRRELVQFFVSQYIELMGKSRLKYLFRRLREEHHQGAAAYAEADGSWWMLEQGSRFGTGSLDNSIRGTKMHGYDLVIAISQTSINNQFRARFQRLNPRWSGADEGETDNEAQDVTIDVRSVSVRLSDEPSRAIVVVHIIEAELGMALLDENVVLKPVAE